MTIDNKQTIISSFTGKYRFLSNFWELDTPITVVGYKVSSVEHAYQAAKFIYFEYDKFPNREFETAFEAIVHVPSPGHAKKLGRILGRAIGVRADWNDAKLGIMRYFVWEKFLTNPSLLTALKETYDWYLQEGNDWGDKYWGVDFKTGRGENHLGKILMELREEFK